MCLIAFAIGAHPRWPLVIAANRDEHFDRPTAPLQRWTSAGGRVIVSGRDLRAGGTWLGLSDGGRVAMLTNVREPGQMPGPRSRGDLPLAWLEGQRPAEQFLDDLDLQAYSGFNLVIGEPLVGQWHWISNRQPAPLGVSPGVQRQRLDPGVYGLSNAFLDTPWPKTVKLAQSLSQSLQAGGQPQHLRKQLWQALADRQRPSDHLLPTTGVPWDSERALSTAWVRFASGHYGTRSSLLTLAESQANGQWRLDIEEKSWDEGRIGQTEQAELIWSIQA